MAHWQRILYVAFIAQVVALIGFSFVNPFLPLYIQTFGIRGAAVPLWSGVISFAQALAMAVISPVWGTVADRYGRKPMVVRAMAAGAVVVGLLIVAPTIWVVLLLRILQGMSTGSTSASQALVASVTPRANMAMSMGLMQAAIFLGAAAGPLVGGVFNDHLGFHGTFAIGAGLLAAAALLVLVGIDEHFTRPVDTAATRRLNPYATARGVLATPGLFAMALVLGMAEFANVVPAPVLALFVQGLPDVPRVHGQPQAATSVGLILAIAGLCASLASWRVQALSRRFGYRRVLIAGAALAGLCYIPGLVVHAVWQLVLMRAAVGLCLGLAMPTASAIVGLVTPEGQRAAAYSLITSASSIGIAIGPLVGSILYAVQGMQLVFGVTAVLLVLVAVVVSRTVREPEIDDTAAGTPGVAGQSARPSPVSRIVTALRGYRGQAR